MEQTRRKEGNNNKGLREREKREWSMDVGIKQGGGGGGNIIHGAKNEAEAPLPPPTTTTTTPL
jgi:hypothetical protein